MATPLTHKTVVAESQVVVFKWIHEATTPHKNDALAATVPFDISNYIQEVSFSKQLSGPAGQFQIILPNDRDWKQYIEKGTWLIIYKSQDGGLSIPNGSERNSVDLSRKIDGDISKTSVKGLKGDKVNLAALRNQRKKIRCIGYVDTVRARGSVGDERGEFDVQYVVSGRDFGVIYEETEIWHNQVLFDATLLETVNANINASKIKTVDGLLKSLHQLFFSPGDLVKEDLKNDSLTTIALQWLLPSQLFVALGIKPNGDTYYGNIPNLLNFKETIATYPIESPTKLLNGIAWDRLKAHSIEPFHELFPELNDDGLPRLNFRVMPWRVTNDTKLFPKLFPTMDKFADAKNGIVEIPNLDIIDWDLGEDNHTRYNLFWSTLNSSMISTQTSNALLGDNDPTTGFPRVIQESVKRHGLNMLYSEVNANIVIGKEEVDSTLLRQFNELAKEFWERSHEYESGTMTIIGNNNIRLGKCIHIENGSQYNSDKFFYIEGYEETFSVDEKGASQWTQSVFLTRGIESATLKDSKLIVKRQTPFVDAGEFTRKTR